MQDGNLKLQPDAVQDTGPAMNTVLDGRLKQQPCVIGAQGFCCKLCMMGPCRIVNDSRKSICGSSRDLIIAKNILRFAVGGTAAHVCHARSLNRFDSPSRREHQPTDYIRRRSPAYLYGKWREAGILPDERRGGHLADMAEAMHMTTLGVNADYGNILANSLKMGLIDGYYGLYLGTELEERRFGGPVVREGNINLGCIRPDKINIAVHGHEPALADCLAREAARYSEVNLVGVCCTGSFLLARHGVPLAAHFLLQEEVIRTGLIEAMVVDVQCILPSIADLCDCYHTVLVSTNEAGRFPNAKHMPAANHASAARVAREIIELAIRNRANRRPEFEEAFNESIPQMQRAVVGHSERSVPTKEIAAAIRGRKIKGVIGVVGCANPRVDCGEWVTAFRELSREYIILSTGCMAFEFGRYGLLDGQRIYHLGSCINNARIAQTLLRISRLLDEPIYNLPFIISAPAPVTEKAMAISLFFAVFGCSIHCGFPYFLTGAPGIADFLRSTMTGMTGAKLYLEDSPSTFLATVRADLY